MLPLVETCWTSSRFNTDSDLLHVLEQTQNQADVFGVEDLLEHPQWDGAGVFEAL